MKKESAKKALVALLFFKLYGCLRGTVEPPVGDHLKMRRVSGRLHEVVAYESLTAQGLLRGEVWTNLLFGENLLHAVSLF